MKIYEFIQLFKFFYLILGFKLLWAFILIFATVLEGIGFMAFIPLLLGPEKESTFSFIPVSITQEPSIIIVFLVLAFVTKGCIAFWALAIISRLTGFLTLTLRGRLFDGTFSIKPELFTKRGIGHFINILNEQTTKTVTAYHYLNQFIIMSIQAIIYLTIAISLSYVFSFVAVSAGIVLFFIFRKLNRYVAEKSKKFANNTTTLIETALENLQSFKYAKATGITEFVVKQFRSRNKDAVSPQIEMLIASNLLTASREPIAVILLGSVLFLHVTLFNSEIASILVSMALFYKGLNCFLGCQQSLQSLNDHYGALKLVQDELDFINLNANPLVFSHSSREFSPISLESVSFSFLGSKNVLDGVSLNINKNQMISIVGPSGGGKSTVAEIITGVLKPTNGILRIGGKVLSDTDRVAWQRQIGYVTQEAQIYRTSIRNNITLASLKGEIEDTEWLLDCIELCSLTDFISGLDQGLDHVLSDRGGNISGGQKQRIMLAREIYKKPTLLILDEATSALDSETEISIQGSLEKLRTKMSIFCIAHRLSTVKDSDEILFLFDGKIIERGTFIDLVKQEDSQFFKFTQNQILS